MSQCRESASPEWGPGGLAAHADTVGARWTTQPISLFTDSLGCPPTVAGQLRPAVRPGCECQAAVSVSPGLREEQCWLRGYGTCWPRASRGVRSQFSFRAWRVLLCSPGNAVRHCSGEKGWLPPELFNCTTVSFVELKAMVGCTLGTCRKRVGFQAGRGPGTAISSSLSRPHPASGSADSRVPTPEPPAPPSAHNSQCHTLSLLPPGVFFQVLFSLTDPPFLCHGHQPKFMLGLGDF